MHLLNVDLHIQWLLLDTDDHEHARNEPKLVRVIGCPPGQPCCQNTCKESTWVKAGITDSVITPRHETSTVQNTCTLSHFSRGVSLGFSASKQADNANPMVESLLGCTKAPQQARSEAGVSPSYKTVP
mmetsp:Transcript_22673/g.52364  ORF Transcript_22673/g.52364 Transcript_22673/m.52364 type:complete len:128 (-) Transcript_22673:2727-3110(-)